MWFQKLIFRLIAGALVLLLVMIDAFPAKTACAGACACCKETKKQLQDSDMDLTLHHRSQGHGVFLAVSHTGHKYLPFSGSFYPDTGPYEGIVNSSCDMKPSRVPEVLLSSAPTVPRADRSLLGDFVFASSGISTNELSFFGFTSRHLVASRAGPTPLYLQNLTLLF